MGVFCKENTQAPGPPTHRPARRGLESWQSSKAQSLPGGSESGSGTALKRGRATLGLLPSQSLDFNGGKAMHLLLHTHTHTHACTHTHAHTPLSFCNVVPEKEKANPADNFFHLQVQFREVRRGKEF